MRQAVQIDLEGGRLVGTHHAPARSAMRSGGVGVLIFNSGYLPRSAAGDLSAQLGDHLAEMGYQVFRFDMPGLGDSPGELHAQVLPFFQFVAEGGHAACAAALAMALKQRYALRGLVLLGNCGGAVTAVYSADRVRSAVIGVVQLDPDFDLAGVEEMEKGVQGKAKSMAKSVRQSVRNRILQSSMGLTVRAAYLGVAKFTRKITRGVRERLVGQRLPPRANLPLIRTWERLAAADVPMLLLVADKSNANPGRFDYVRYLLRNKPRSVSHMEIAGTTHSFATGNGKRMVREQVEQWLLLHAPAREGGQEMVPETVGLGRQVSAAV